MFGDLGDRKELGRYLALAQVGLEMVVPIGVGLALDFYLGWTPWGVIGGAVLGLVGGLAHLVHLAGKGDAGPSPPHTPGSQPPPPRGP
jgi:F0F1-type ATP synthase assembly protein I